ncbi:MAG: hypothetical protein ACYCVN_14685 [Acidimicrobiales bacterium]
MSSPDGDQPARGDVFRAEIHGTAQRLRVAHDDDIEHAYEHALAWAELADEPPRYLVVNPARSGTSSI